MTFNPLAALLVRGLVDLLDEKPTVIQLGNQTFNPDRVSLQTVIDRSRGAARIDVDGLEKLSQIAPAERQDRTAEFCRLLGFSDYQAIDVNDKYGSLIMDLNRSLVEDYDYRETFSLVTNIGTGEHVFNQDAIFRNSHDLCETGGLMVHVMPFMEYVNHGFYNFHPNLYYALAMANGYRLLGLAVATRNGHGVLATPPNSPEQFPPYLLDERRFDLATLLSNAKPPKPGLKGTIIDLARRATGAPSAGQRFHAEIRRLQSKRPKLLLVAVLRKLEDSPFKTPIQTRYAEDIGDDDLRTHFSNRSDGNR